MSAFQNKTSSENIELPVELPFGQIPVLSLQQEMAYRSALADGNVDMAKAIKEKAGQEFQREAAAQLGMLEEIKAHVGEGARMYPARENGKYTGRIISINDLYALQQLHESKSFVAHSLEKLGEQNLQVGERYWMIYENDQLKVRRAKQNTLVKDKNMTEGEISTLRKMASYREAAIENLNSRISINEVAEIVAQAVQKMNEEKSRYLEVQIGNTANAAFVDLGREQEISRILEAAADRIEEWWGRADNDHYPLHDLNGNKVGQLCLSTDSVSTDAIADGEVRLRVRYDLDSEAHEVAQHLRSAASEIMKGRVDFPIYDTHGNHVGDGSIRDLPSLEKEGAIDMREALFSGVYLADGGYSGIADGEYRYVVPTNGFEPGYRQGEGDAWLVNAKGEKAPGYEEPQTVRETDFRELKQDERDALREVVEGRVTFEDFERRFEDADPAP